MTIEEKAKAYDEVREKIALRFGTIVADEIFSQFEMSEDERIRKELIDAIQGLWDNDALPMPLSVNRKDKWITWLEKQGEQKFAWSEDDELVVEDVEEAIINYWHGQSQEDLLDWLKSIKQRIGG